MLTKHCRMLLIITTSDKMPQEKRRHGPTRSAGDFPRPADGGHGPRRPDPGGAGLLPQPIEIEKGGHVPADERLERWFAEAVGYKVRYVPTSLPDLLKTDEVIRHEFRDAAPAVPRSRIAVASEKLATQRRPESDLEVCSPRQS